MLIKYQHWQNKSLLGTDCLEYFSLLSLIILIHLTYLCTLDFNCQPSVSTEGRAAAGARLRHNMAWPEQRQSAASSCWSTQTWDQCGNNTQTVIIIIISSSLVIADVSSIKVTRLHIILANIIKNVSMHEILKISQTNYQSFLLNLSFTKFRII